MKRFMIWPWPENVRVSLFMKCVVLKKYFQYLRDAPNYEWNMKSSSQLKNQQNSYLHTRADIGCTVYSSRINLNH